MCQTAGSKSWSGTSRAPFAALLTSHWSKWSCKCLAEALLSLCSLVVAAVMFIQADRSGLITHTKKEQNTKGLVTVHGERRQRGERRSRSRVNSLIITFPVTIFQLARYRSVRKPVDTLCLPPTGLEATLHSSWLEISTVKCIRTNTLAWEMTQTCKDGSKCG